MITPIPETKIKTEITVLDLLLKGGIETDVITTIYGPSGTGKSNICILTAANFAKNGKKVIYIDTEGGFSVERFKQVTQNDITSLDNILILQPLTFEEQRDVFSKLNNLVTDEISLIVVDTISMLYRLEMGRSEDIYSINRELGRQLSNLTEITRRRKIPIIITNQVYANFEEKNKVNMVGGDIMKYGSKCLIELQKTNEGQRSANLRKHRSIIEGEKIDFKIENTDMTNLIINSENNE